MRNEIFISISLLFFSIFLLFFNNNIIYSQITENVSTFVKNQNNGSNISITGNSTLDFELTGSNITITDNSTLDEAIQSSNKNINKTSEIPPPPLSSIDLTNVCSRSITHNCVEWDPLRANFLDNYGDHHQGADISRHINPAWIDNPNGENTIYYDRFFEGYSQAAPGKWVGSESGGLGYDIVDLNNNGKPELIFAWVDNPEGENHAYYYIGYDIDDRDNPTGGWSDLKTIAPGKWIGAETAEASVYLEDLNNNGRPELIFAWVDAPNGQDYAYYSIGFDLDSAGNPTGDWIGARPIARDQPLGSATSGVGITFEDINRNGRPDMIFYYINELGPGGNQYDHGFYKVGYDLNYLGDVSYFSKTAMIPHQFGVTSDGGGISVYIRNNGTAQMLAYFMNNVSPENKGHAYIGEYRR